MTDKKEDRFPESITTGIFASAKKGTPEYKVAIHEKRIADGEFEWSAGLGGHGAEPYYFFKPRYSKYMPGRTTESGILPFMDEEKRSFELALQGSLGEGMKTFAKNHGLSGICEKHTRTAGGVLVEDLIGPQERIHVIVNDNIEGLWELASDFENPQADRRAKNDWKLMPVWEKGMRFRIRPNTMGIDIVKERYETLAKSLEETGDTDRAKHFRSLMEDESHLLGQAGWLIKASRVSGSETNADHLPEGFLLHLRPVPVVTLQDAIDSIAGAEAWNLREVLEYLVDGKKVMPAHRIADLLECSISGMGYFEPMEED